MITLPNNVSMLDTPSLLVYPDIVSHNITTAMQMVSNDSSRLRPHIKTHKTKEVIQLCQARGIQSFKAATMSEIELLCECRVSDALLAMQPSGAKFKKLMELRERFPKTKISCLVDDAGFCIHLADFLKYSSGQLDVFIDVNAGMNRTGINIDHVEDLAVYINGLEGLHLRGLHVYDGHLYMPDLGERTIKAELIYSRIKTITDHLAEKGITMERPIMGGSPTFPIYAGKNDVICSPGTFVFWDAGYAESFPEQAFSPAVYILGSVVSRPAEDRLCLDIGHKAVAAENPLHRRMVFPHHPTLKVVGQSEEHLVVEHGPEDQLNIGDYVLACPIHVCPTIALHEVLYIMEDGDITGAKWKVVARKR